VTVPLAPRTARAIDLVVGERCDGPIFVGTDGRRIDRHAAGRIVRRMARRAGIVKRVGPHTLRHAFITAALDAGVPLRDVQEAARHADPRTTMRNDRARVSLDRHATYIVATFLAGASRRPHLPALARDRSSGDYALVAPPIAARLSTGRSIVAGGSAGWSVSPPQRPRRRWSSPPC
jgi:hypothetical protein